MSVSKQNVNIARMEKAFKSKSRTYPKNQEYFDLLKKYDITDSEIAQAYGYSSAISYRASSSREKNQKRTVSLIKLMSSKIVAKLS